MRVAGLSNAVRMDFEEVLVRADEVYHRTQSAYDAIVSVNIVTKLRAMHLQSVWERQELAAHRLFHERSGQRFHLSSGCCEWHRPDSSACRGRAVLPATGLLLPPILPHDPEDFPFEAASGRHWWSRLGAHSRSSLQGSWPLSRW